MPPNPTGPYPPAAPTVAGFDLTVSLFLQSPPRVQRAVRDLTLQRFVADVAFGTGPTATGGSVMHDQVTTPDLYMNEDVEEIAPGAEFPILTSPEVAPIVAVARKYGGEVFLTAEQIRRNNTQVLNREMTRLRNTIIRRVDTIAMATLRAAPIQTMAASGDWSAAATDIVADLVTAAGMVNSLDMGYVVDTALINPAQQVDLLKDKDIRDALPKERNDSIIRTGNLGQLMGIDFLVSNRVAPGEVILLQRGIVGGISDELPLYARTFEEPRPERTYVHAARVPAAYVTDPLAAVRVTGA